MKRYVCSEQEKNLILNGTCCSQHLVEIFLVVETILNTLYNVEKHSRFVLCIICI